MACGQSFYEDNPRREQEREQRRQKLNKEAADKLNSFFEVQAGRGNVSVVRSGHRQDHDCKKIFLTRGPQTLTVHHRGYEISVSGDPTALAQAFEEWRRGNMSHARIHPQDH